ncbi:MAG: glutaryl-7-ACA acylase [Gemmatales bacterium]|nr:MAG: glutaryl-7-ACA acylase [Gemmatales bacterium]
MKVVLKVVTALFFASVSASSLSAQSVEYIKAHYTKYEYRIPMRDGKRLFTAVYVPKDDSRRYPILFKRTPYSVRPYGVDRYPSQLGPSELFARSGYIFAYQDVRGRWMSEGEFVHMRPHLEKKGPKDIDESTDTYDTIDFLVKNVPNNNGKVGMWGISYPGFYVAAGMIDAHPALKAASPQAPVIDWFTGDDWHHNGAFFLAHAFHFLSRHGIYRPKPTKKFGRTFDYGTPDGYEFFLRVGTAADVKARFFTDEPVPFWDKLMQHGTFDHFWQARNLRPHLKNIKPPVLSVGGWFDAENLFGVLATFKSIERQGFQSRNMIVMGPWHHGGWESGDGASLGHVSFNAKTAIFYREKIEFPFFESYLKGKGDYQGPKAWMFETGTNQWRRYPTWPPKTARKKALYLRANGSLSFTPPDEAEGEYDEYTSDPAKPVPYIGKPVVGMVPEYMVADQRFAASRPDVLVYQTEPLEEDITLAGPIRVRLHVSTTGTDSDWIVKLIDVYPDDYPDPQPNPTEVRMGGFQQLVRGDVIRGKFRNSLEKPAPFTPGKPTQITFDIPDVYHSFRREHRIMVQIQSTWFPLVDRNPQKFMNIYQAKVGDFDKAVQRVYRSPTRSSRLEVFVLP